MHIYFYDQDEKNHFYYSQKSAETALAPLAGRTVEAVYIDVESCSQDVYPEECTDGNGVSINFSGDGQFILLTDQGCLHGRSYGQGLLSLNWEAKSVVPGDAMEPDEAYGKLFLKEPYSCLHSFSGRPIAAVQLRMGQSLVCDRGDFTPSPGAEWPQALRLCFDDGTWLEWGGREDWMTLSVSGQYDLRHLAAELAHVTEEFYTEA